MKKEIKKEVDAMYESIKGYMAKHRKGSKHWGKKDLEGILQAYKNGGDYSEVWKTKLYNQYGGEYCQLLCGINLWMDGKLN